MRIVIGTVIEAFVFNNWRELNNGSSSQKIVRFMKNKHRIGELISLNAELENYFKNTVIPQMFVDADLILRKFTPPAIRQFQLSENDIGKRISELKIRIRYPTIIDNIQEVIDTNLEIEKDIQTTDLKWYQMNIVPYIIGETKQTSGVIITFVDISFRIEILDECETLNKKYETLLFALSHDLKGPVNNINSLITLLKDACMNDEAEAILLMATMSASVVKLLKNIDDLTETAHYNSKLAEVTERVNIQNILEDVRIGLGDKFYVTNARIYTDFLVTELIFSRKNIRSILYNLISNALKFCDLGKSPKLWIKTNYTGEYVLLSVRDNGIGIKNSELQTIFYPRTRLNQNIDGTGTGLYIVKRMVEEMGGKVEVESTPGEGSNFLVYFKRG